MIQQALIVTLDTARSYVSIGSVSLYLARLFDLDVWTVVCREGPDRVVPTGNKPVTELVYLHYI
jgi:hypothetical protein